MRKKITLSLLVAIVAITISAFNKSERQRVDTIAERHQQRFEAFVKELNYFHSLLPDTNPNLDRLQASFLRIRERFKAWEYLAAFLDEEFVKVYVNGAPLPKIRPQVANLEIVEPGGLQVMDELLFTGDIDENREELIKHTVDLLEVLDQYKFMPHPIYDRKVLEAARRELVRMYTLGLTGFDVPASGNSIPDAITVMKTMEEDLKVYEKFFENVNEEQTEELYNTLSTFIMYLEQHNDFDNLDRLYVLRTFVNPLYATLLELHQKSGIEMMHEVKNEAFLPPYNHRSKNLFANDFLDCSKYIQLPPAFTTGKTVALGKLLFYDPVLSANIKRSCASCHKPEKGFTDGQPKSLALGFDGTVDRNSPTLINCVYSERFFHDMRSDALEDQVEHVLVNRKEFDTDMIELVNKLKLSDEYVQLFEESFAEYPGEKLNSTTITFALSAFVSSLSGFDSEFDKYVRGETSFIKPEIRNGYNLFMGKAVCGTCHFAPVFNGTVPPLYEESESEVLGVPADPYAKKPVLDDDKGRGLARNKERVYFYNYSFKTPTIRNAALTGPYMHNGAYKTLDDVVDFYNKGGGAGIGIDIEHQTLPFDSLSLKKAEMKDIVAFMNALTDTTNMTSVPAKLPVFRDSLSWNNRKVGGEY